MSLLIWNKEPVEVVQGFESRHSGRGPSGGLALWAVWCVEGLYYLDDLDEAHQLAKPDDSRFNPHVKDISHIRWATGTAITAIDLCAAILGRDCSVQNGSKELDLRNFDPSGTSKNTPRFRAMLPTFARDWVDGVLADNRYKEVHAARKPLTHSRLIADFYLNGPTKFNIAKTGGKKSVRDLVTMSKELAKDQVTAFLEVLEKL